MSEFFKIPFHEFVRVERALNRGEWHILDEVKKPTGVNFDDALARHLVDYVVQREWSSVNEMDGWLAPRVHAALRFPRRLASDRGVWFWLAATAFKPYVEARFPKKLKESKDPWWRYTGDALRNAVSRLWWGAEMLRSGPDYSAVSPAFTTVRTFMFVSELRYSCYREGARAFARVASGVETGSPLGDDGSQELSKRFNTYLALDLLESHGTLSTTNEPSEWDEAWRAKPISWDELLNGDLRTLGPKSGISDAAREDAVVAWLKSILPEIQPVEAA